MLISVFLYRIIWVGTIVIKIINIRVSVAVHGLKLEIRNWGKMNVHDYSFQLLRMTQYALLVAVRGLKLEIRK